MPGFNPRLDQATLFIGQQSIGLHDQIWVWVMGEVNTADRPFTGNPRAYSVPGNDLWSRANQLIAEYRWEEKLGALVRGTVSNFSFKGQKQELNQEVRNREWLSQLPTKVDLFIHTHSAPCLFPSWHLP